MKKEDIPVKKNYETLTFWKAQVDAAKTHLKDFHTAADKIENKYRCVERLGRDPLESNYNILYSNTETITPILFSETPEVDVRAQDTKSVPARQAAKMLEHTLQQDVKLPDTFEAFESSVKDMLLGGMGFVRVKYKPYFAERSIAGVDEEGFEVEETEEYVAAECVEYCYTYWKDVIFPKSRKWKDLPWIAERGLYTYDEAKEEFGKATAAKLNYCFKDEDDRVGSAEHKELDAFSRAEVWEVWFKQERKVIWFSDSKELDAPLRIEDDPLDLDEFYPFPKPLFSCTTNSTIIPVPLYKQYQDLAEELNDVSTRIRRIVDNLRRRGVYDETFSQLQNMVNGGDNQFFPIKDFAKMQEKGGLQAIMATEDLAPQANVLVTLYQQRKEIVGTIYEVMGYADILRGVSDPRETASAQRIKGRFGTLRISRFQREVQRFIRDAVQIAGQIVVNKFEPRSIALITGIEIEKVARMLEILEQTEPSSVLVDIQTDSTIAADDMADKEELVEFVTAITGFIAQAQMMVETIGLQATSDLLLIIVKKFKMGRDIEQSIIDRVAELQQEAAQKESEPEQPSIEQLNYQLEQGKLQQKNAKDQSDALIDQAKLMLEERKVVLEEAKAGNEALNEDKRIDFEGIKLSIDAMKVMAEAENPNDNAIVGA